MGAWSSWELPGLEGGTRRALLTARISTVGFSFITSHNPSGSCSQVLFPPQHQKSQVISAQRSRPSAGPALRWPVHVPVPVPVPGEEQQTAREMLRTCRAALAGGQGKDTPWEDTTRVCGGPRPRPPQPPVPTTSLLAAEADKGRSGRSRASKWKSKQLSGTDASCRGQCHLGRAWRCPEGRGAGLRALAAHWGVLRAPTPPCLCPGHHHGLCSGGGKILGYGEPRLGPGQRLNLDKSQHHLCIYLTVPAPAPLEAEGKGTFLPSCPSPGTLCAPDLQRC